VFYILWLYLVVGLRTEHIGILGGIIALFFLTERTNRIICGIFMFLAWAVIYDSLGAIPGYSFMPVHIQDLYEAEKSWFGIMQNGLCITPNEYFAQHLNTFSDIVSGISYLMWMPFPIAIGIYLTIKQPRHLMYYSFCFLFCNMIGLIGYYGFPAAPPWYVAEHGFEFIKEAKGSASYLMRFDDLIGIPIYEGIYGKNGNIFGAIPSLHCAYPVITLYYMVKYRYKILSLISFTYMLGTWYGAVYSMQHYIIDVLLGIICAIFAIAICEKIIFKTRVDNWLYRLSEYLK
jgi:hypothetical protein